MQADELIRAAIERGLLSDKLETYLFKTAVRERIIALQQPVFQCLCVLPASRIILHEMLSPVTDIVFVHGRLKIAADATRGSPWPVVFLLNTGKPRSISIGGYGPMDGHLLAVGEIKAYPERWLKAASVQFEETKHHDATVDANALKHPPSDSQAQQSTFLLCTLGRYGKQTVETHDVLYAKLDHLFQFDHDPCPVSPTADAMHSTWGRRNYVNPPFRCTAGFVVRAMQQAEEHGAQSVILCTASTQTAYFFHLCASGYLRGVVFLYGSVPFKGHTMGLPRPLLLLVIGPKRPAQPGAAALRCYSFAPDCVPCKRSFLPSNTLVSHFHELGWA